MKKSGKYKSVFDKPFFKEFAVKGTNNAGKVNSELLNHGILGGFDLSSEYPELTNSLLLCVTEKRTKEEIDKLASVLAGMKEGN